jgi:hypothetical protein
MLFDNGSVSMIFVIFSDWVSFLAYPNLFGIKGYVVVVLKTQNKNNLEKLPNNGNAIKIIPILLQDSVQHLQPYIARIIR